MLDRLTSKDFRLMAVCTVVAILSLFIILQFFYKAFPEASIDFKVTQKQSQQIAHEWLQKLALNPAAYRHAAIFSYDDAAKTFLEKELGAEQANQMMGSQVRLWRYSHRWYRSLQKEEYTVLISPKGEFLGFDHTIAEEQPGAYLSADSAKALAAAFLLNTAAIDPDELEFVEQSQNERPKRLDHNFTWKRKGFLIQDADYRYRVIIQGEQVGAFAEYLHVPEKWSRDYEKLRAKNDTAGTVSALFLFLTLMAMLVMFVVYIRHRDIRWNTALIFGLVATGLSLLSSLNNLPINMYGFPTTDSFSSLITRTLLSDLLQALGTGLLIFFLTAAAEPIYREQFPQQPSLTNVFRWRGLRSKHFFNAMIVGLTLTFFFGAYQIIFYLVAKKFGGWAPQDVPYDNMLNTAFPWVFVLFMGFLPAVSEEFMSRMFSIPFLQKFIKVRWLAILIPAVIWGFAHSNYPQQPFFIRGLEVGIAGILIGVFMLRFGILATLVWHYCVDALYTSVLLFRSGNLYYILTAAVSCGLLLAPLVIALAAYWRKGGFTPDAELANITEGVQRTSPSLPVKAEETDASDYQRLPLHRLAWGMIGGLVLCLLYVTPIEKVGDFIQFPSSRQQAEEAARQFVQQQGFNVQDYQTVTTVSERFDPITAKYVLEKAPVARLNQLYEKESKGSRWCVRFFKPLQREEYRIYLDPKSLALVSFSRELEEEAAGATIVQDSARAIAARFAQLHGVAVQQMELKEAQEEKRKNRTDHTFTWEAPENDPANLQEMKYRCTVVIQGDQPALFTIFPKLAETYIRDREKKTLFNNLLLGLRIIILGGILGLMILQLVRHIRQGEIQWKKALLWASVPALLMLADRLLQMQQLLASYPTSISIDLFRISTLVGTLIVVLGAYVASVFIFALCFTLYPQTSRIFRAGTRRKMAFDAIMASLIALLFRMGFRRLQELLFLWFSRFALVRELGLPGDVDAAQPWLSALSSSVNSALFTAGIIAITIYLLKTWLPNKRLWPLIALLFILAMIPSSVRTGGEVLLSVALFVLSITWIVLSVVWFGRDNLLFYPLAFFMVNILDGATTFLRQGQPGLFGQGIALLLLLALLMIWLLWPTLRKSKI